jgi:hypothetical protein
MKKLDLRTGKPCLICGKTPLQSNHALCGQELDRLKREKKIGFGGITQASKETGVRNATQKKYQSGRVAPFMES